MQMPLQLDPGAALNAMPQPDHCAGHWYALCTRSRHEKRIAEQLDERNITFFLPLYQTVRRWADRSKQVTLPLFPGYLFVRIPLSERLRVLKIAGVVRFVGFDSSPTAVPDTEIETLQSALNNHVSVDPHPYLKVGSRVRIKSGPLQGAEGILKRKKGVTRLILSLDLIMRSVSVEVSAVDTYEIQ
jgi:transcription antitermination factor NusG